MLLIYRNFYYQYSLDCLSNLWEINPIENGFYFILNEVAVCFQRIEVNNPTGQWTLIISLPVEFKDINSFMSVVNSDSEKQSQLIATNTGTNVISISSFGGITSKFNLNVMTVGIIKK